MTGQQKKILTMLTTIFVIIVVLAFILWIGLILLSKMDYLKAFN